MDEQKEFTPIESRLYFFLLNLANRFFWKAEWLEYGDDKMQTAIGISAGSLRTARKNLKEAKLVDFIVGGNGFRVRTRYQILTPIPDPFPNPIPDPFSDPIHYREPLKTLFSRHCECSDAIQNIEFQCIASDYRPRNDV